MSRDFKAGLIVGVILAFLSVLAVGKLARAFAEDWLVISGLAKHLDGREHCNSVTSGLGLEYDGYAAGFYRNSNCRWSAYAAKSWLPLRAGQVRIGGLVGAVTGYGATLLPVAAFAASLEGEKYGLNLVLVPPTGSASPGVAWLQFKVKLR